MTLLWSMDDSAWLTGIFLLCIQTDSGPIVHCVLKQYPRFLYKMLIYLNVGKMLARNLLLEVVEGQPIWRHLWFLNLLWLVINKTSYRLRAISFQIWNISITSGFKCEIFRWIRWEMFAKCRQQMDKVFLKLI